MADPAINADAFHSVWGTGNVAPAAAAADSVTRSLDPKTFDSQWLTPGPKEPTREDTSTFTSSANSGLGGIIEGLPIVGPGIKSGTEKVAARIRSMMYSTPYKDELEAVQNYSKQSAEDHPVLNATGQVTGAVAPMLLGAGLAPKAFGMVGPLGQRMLIGGATNAAINGADAFARTDGDLKAARDAAAVGGVIGGGLPVVGRGIGIVGNKLLGSADTAANALIDKATAMGIPIRFAQASDSPFVAKLSQMAGRLPGSGMDALHGEQQTSFNRAVAKTFGEDADKITPDVMAAAKKRIGADLDHVASNSTVKFDNILGNDLHAIAADAEKTVAGSELSVLHKQVHNILDKVTGAGEITGDAYQALTRRGSPLDRAMKSNDSNVKYYASQLKEKLDDALERSASPELIDKLRNARSQYKAMKTIEDLAEKSTTGDISPALLMNPVRQSYGNMAYGGGGDLADLSRIGQRFMKQPPDSGTPLGSAALNLLLGAGSGAGTALYGGGDLNSTIKGAAIGALALPATALAARGVTSVLNQPQVVNRLIQRGVPAVVPAANQFALPAR